MKKFPVCLFLFAFIALLFIQNSAAQCSGNVLFSENFGGNASSPIVGSPLPTSVTSYSFNGTTDVSDGQYSIRNTTANLTNGGRQFGVWHIGPDHSGSGYMMVVNADYTAGKFYETRVDNLCSGSQLYFSAWVANLIPLGNGNPLDPILKFEISSAVTGNVLQNFVPAAIPRYSSLTWSQYGFSFSLPAGESSVILRIFNSQAGGLGNDLCLDDIEFTLCGPAIAPVVTGTYQNGTDACIGANLAFAGNVAGGFYQNPAYQWQFNNGVSGWVNIPGAITPNYSINNAQVSNSGTYRLLVAESTNINSANCRAISPLIPLNVYAPSPPVLVSNQPVCEGDSIRLYTSTSALQYLWTTPSTVFPVNNDTLTISNASLQDAATYTLDVVTSGGCTSKSSINVAVQTNQLQRIVPFDILLCDAQSLFIDADQPGAVSFLWQDGLTSAQRIIATAGNYSILTSDGVCKRNDSFVITHNFTPVVNLGPDTTLCYNELLLLNAKDPFTDTYLWNTNSTDSAISVNTAGNYRVTLSNLCGTATDAITVLYEDCANIIYVPNAFTPNNDRLNDVLKAKAYFRVESFDFKLFDRWGKQIFGTTSLNTGWDGTINSRQAPPGLYTWVIKYQRSGKIYNQKGTVLVIY